jgi:arginase family enzyme
MIAPSSSEWGPLGTGTPEGGGLSTRELMELVREIMTHLPVKAVDIVEVSPPLILQISPAGLP